MRSVRFGVYAIGCIALLAGINHELFGDAWGHAFVGASSITLVTFALGGWLRRRRAHQNAEPWRWSDATPDAHSPPSG